MAEMTRQEIIETVSKMAGELVPDLEGVILSEDSTINTDTGMDSMSMILLVTKVESRFNITIPEEEWDTIQTLGELVDKIQTAMKEKD